MSLSTQTNYYSIISNERFLSTTVQLFNFRLAYGWKSKW